MQVTVFKPQPAGSGANIRLSRKTLKLGRYLSLTVSGAPTQTMTLLLPGHLAPAENSTTYIRRQSVSLALQTRENTIHLRAIRPGKARLRALLEDMYAPQDTGILDLGWIEVT
jgi:hypothetical protein